MTMPAFAGELVIQQVSPTIILTAPTVPSIVLNTGAQGPRGVTGPPSSWGTIPGSIADQTDLQTALNLKIDTSAKGTMNGVATLDGAGKIPVGQLPGLAMTTIRAVASQAAQLALTADQGDICIRADLNRTYAQNGGTSGTMDDWSELLTPTDSVTSVAGRAGAITLAKTDVGLSAVDNTADVDKPVSTATATALALKIDSTQKGAANGVATLDGTSKIPVSQLPGLALTTINTVASQTLQLALVAQQGDVVIRTDLNKTYANNGGTSATMADWSELLSPSGGVTSVAGRIGAVTLAKADVGLSAVDNTADTAKPVSTATQTALNAKAALAGAAFTGGITGTTATFSGNITAPNILSNTTLFNIVGIASISAPTDYVIKGNTIMKLAATAAWDVAATVGPAYTGSIYVSGRLDTSGSIVSFGINTGPNYNIGTAPYSIRTDAAKNAYAYLGNTQDALLGAVDGNSYFGILYDGSVVQMFISGNLVKTYPSGPGLKWMTMLHIWSGGFFELTTQIAFRSPRGMSLSFKGKPIANETLAFQIAPWPFTMSSSNNVCTALVAATSAVGFAVKVNGTQIGTFAFAAGATTATYTTSGSQTISQNDLVTITGGATPDATLANIAFLLR